MSGRTGGQLFSEILAATLIRLTFDGEYAFAWHPARTEQPRRTNGELGWVRTIDILIKSQALYH
jgi:hypothetical protein